MLRRRSLSVVIPAFKQQKTIATDIKNIAKVLESLDFDYEIIVVVDGMLDKTYEVAKKLRSRRIKVLGYQKNCGKGYAVRYGMMRAKGDIIGFIDAGMDIHPSGILMLINHLDWYNADIIIGSKLHPVSKVKYPWQRKILSQGYRTLVRLLFGLQIRDTQVGMKFFKKEVVGAVLPRITIRDYAFDIEMLAVAKRLGFKRIYEAPIELNFRGASSITSSSLWKIIALMLRDTFAVFYRLKILRYYDRKPKVKESFA